MAGSTANRLVLLFALTGGGCLLYTDPINHPPRVRIIPPGAAPTRSSHTKLMVEVEDDEDTDGEARASLLRSLQWTQTAGTCNTPAGAPINGVGEVFEVVAPDEGKLCVRVVATDSRGARSEEATLGLTISNNAPTVDLQALAPRSPSGKMRLYAHVELSAAGSKDPDGDKLTFSWNATRPDGQNLALAPCQGAIPEDAHRCFSALVPGHYQASVTASDGLRDSVPQTVSFDVDEDLPPCLIKSDPQTLQPVALVPAGGKRTFEVLVVDDDGEPFPTAAGAMGAPIFVWSKADDGKTMVRLSNNAPRLDVSEGLFDVVRPGDQLRVRVEVRDRMREEMFERRELPPPCPDETAVCMVGGCLRWTTWKVQFFP